MHSCTVLCLLRLYECRGAAQAQQRYRERRKQRFVELESTLDSMSLQLQQLQGVQQQNQALQARPHDTRACSVL